MKKGIAIGALVLFVGLTSGCGGKTLTCTRTNDEDGMKSTEKMKVIFDGDGKEAKKYEVTYNISVDKDKKDELDETYDLLSTAVDFFKEMDGVKVKTSKSSKKATVKMSVNVDKISSSDKEKLDLEEIESSYKEVKERYEDMDYTCK